MRLHLILILGLASNLLISSTASASKRPDLSKPVATIGSEVITAQELYQAQEKSLGGNKKITHLKQSDLNAFSSQILHFMIQEKMLELKTSPEAKAKAETTATESLKNQKKDLGAKGFSDYLRQKRLNEEGYFKQLTEKLLWSHILKESNLLPNLPLIKN